MALGLSQIVRQLNTLRARKIRATIFIYIYIHTYIHTVLFYKSVLSFTVWRINKNKGLRYEPNSRSNKYMQAYANEHNVDNYKRCTGLTVSVNSLGSHENPYYNISVTNEGITVTYQVRNFI
jgi:hypothetical protein